jgi:hypothetical protein
MTANVVRKEPYAIGSPLVGASACVLTILTAVIVPQFKDGSTLQHYIHGLVNQRGPTTYLILIVTYNVAIALILARRWKGPLSTPCLMSYPLASLLPVLLGILGTLQGVGMVVSYLAAPELDRARLALSSRRVIRPIALWCVCISGPSIFQLATHEKKSDVQPCNRAYR